MRHHFLSVWTSILLLTGDMGSTHGIILRRPWSAAGRAAAGELIGALHHAGGLFRAAPAVSLDDLANVRVPVADGVEVQAFVARPNEPSADDPAPVLLLIHEFFGLSSSIVAKATSLSAELGCVVVAPDTFRGETPTFIPRCIWLALTTPQSRVNDDLDAVLAWCEQEPDIDPNNLAAMGFCCKLHVVFCNNLAIPDVRSSSSLCLFLSLISIDGGGKAIRYTSERRPSAATVVCYGSPLTDAAQLRRLTAPVCGVFGAQDAQFPPPVLAAFRNALREAGVASDVRVYDGVGHAFWKDMGPVERGEPGPVLETWRQVTAFLREHYEIT